MAESFTIRLLKREELHSDLLARFDRYQETVRAWIPGDSSAALKDTFFVDAWDDAKKRQVVAYLQECLSQGGLVAAVFAENVLKGFSCVEGKAFGSNGQYRELTYLHISRELRGHGLGRRLFGLTCSAARAIGAEKLYMGAHPSQESQAFYRAMGCIPAKEINPEILAREPLDIQLEFDLTGEVPPWVETDEGNC
ncbi:MAG: GNAT family N-acetyltransferase [Anaerolineae bacterium]|nr:GNAT family N-acetyltransferase [Anaerolineae bacterium]